MRSTHISSVLAFLSLSAAVPTSWTTKDPLPLVIWHGLGDNYLADGIQEVGELAEQVNPGTFVYNVRLANDAGSDRSATFFGNVTTQLAQVCNDLATHPILSTAPAINALGFSQGGQFLRGYIERCNSPPVRSLVTFGSQHNGIAKFQDCGASDWLCKGAMALLQTNAWSTFVQNRLVPAQYYREVNETTGLGSDNYLEFSNFLADINNEREFKNETYKKNLASLKKFVMFVFEDDTTVIPKETGWFAEVNATSGKVTPLKHRPMYKEDWLGLKKLDHKGALVFKTIPGPHMHLDDKVLKHAFKKYFSPPTKKAIFQEVFLGDWEL
ncbi:palmitoyl protein thioesterase [Phyllosticta citricarpa]|uniref:Palmitoyl-protein thioesterase 1 n=2 Tax=Phyllosticta TaxID=121621 RepID=A0ABR1L7J1_9PEZI